MKFLYQKMTQNMVIIRKPMLFLTVALAAFVLLAGNHTLVVEAQGLLGRTQVWVDGELFDSVVTPATFKPESDPFDELYTCGPAGTFKDGIGLISDAKPGDQDYNGGRWHLNVLKEGKTCDGNADSFEDLNPDDFESTDMYFECPLLPRRGHNS